MALTGNPLHVQFSVIGGPDVRVHIVGPDSAVILLPDRMPLLVNLMTGDAVPAEDDYCGRYWPITER